jgi:WD40 repeat protein
MNETHNRFSAFDDYGFRNLPQHLINIGQVQKLKTILLGFDWLAAKARWNYVNELLDDFDQSLTIISLEDPDRNMLEAVQEAIRLSENIITIRPEEIGIQLVSKLLALDEPKAQNLIGEIDRKLPRPRLFPIWPSLSRPGGPLVRTYKRRVGGHGNDIALTPDEKYAAVIYGDSTIYCYLVVWQLDTGVQSCSIKTRFLHRVGIREDGKFVAAYGDGNLHTWEVPSGTQLRTIDVAQQDKITSTAISTNAEIGMFGHTSGKVVIWDIASGTIRHSLRGYRSRVMCTSISPDNLYTAAASAVKKDKVKIWDLKSGRMVRRLPILVPGMVAMGPKGELLVTSDRDYALQVWRVRPVKKLFTLKGHTGSITSIDISSDGRSVVSTSHDRTVKIWNLDNGRLITSLQDHVGSVYDVIFAYDHQHMYSIAMDGNFNKWKVKFKNIASAYSHHRGHEAKINAIDMTEYGTLGISGAEDGTVKVWDLENKSLLKTLGPHEKDVKALAISDSGIAIIWSEDLSLKFWNVDTGELLHDFVASSIDRIAITPDGTRAVTIGSYRMDLWDIENGEKCQEIRLWDYPEKSKFIKDMRYQKDSESFLMVFDTHDREISLWQFDLSKGEFSFVNQGYVSKPKKDSLVSSTKDLVHAALWTCGTKAVVTGGGEDQIRLYDIQKQKTLFAYKERLGWSYRVSLNPQGDLVVGAQKDIVIWDAYSGDFLTSFTGDASFVDAKMGSNGRIFARDTQNVLHLFHYQS